MALSVRIEPSGAAFPAGPGMSILQAADAALHALPASCRNGTCRTCISHLLEGRAHSLIDWPGLSAEEKAQGCILPCVYAASTDLRLRIGPPV